MQFKYDFILYYKIYFRIISSYGFKIKNTINNQTEGCSSAAITAASTVVPLLSQKTSR